MHLSVHLYGSSRNAAFHHPRVLPGQAGRGIATVSSRGFFEKRCEKSDRTELNGETQSISIALNALNPGEICVVEKKISD